MSFQPALWSRLTAMSVADAQGTGLLERSAELARLGQLIDLAEAGRGSIALIEGETGIGKSALLGAAEQLALNRRLRVLRARAGRLEREVGWNLVRHLFDAVIHAPAAERRKRLRIQIWVLRLHVGNRQLDVLERDTPVVLACARALAAALPAHTVRVMCSSVVVSALVGSRNAWASEAPNPPDEQPHH